MSSAYYIEYLDLGIEYQLELRKGGESENPPISYKYPLDELPKEQHTNSTEMYWQDGLETDTLN